MIKVVEVRANDDFSLNLRFADGTAKRFNAKPYLEYEVFRELKDLAYFKQVSIAFGTVQWPHEQDISPETLYVEGVPVSAASAEDHSNAV
jgi:hypothetical protein